MNDAMIRNQIVIALSRDVQTKLDRNIAAEVEDRGLGTITDSRYKRKTAERLDVQFNAAAFRFIRALPCDDSGTCQTCMGEGQHLRFAPAHQECETCNGSGECPCNHDMTIHQQEPS